MSSRTAERLVFAVILVLVVAWFTQQQQQSMPQAFTPLSNSNCAPCPQTSSASIVLRNRKQSYDKETTASSQLSLNHSLAMRYSRGESLHHSSDSSPSSGQARFIHPSLQSFRFSSLLTSIEDPRRFKSWGPLGLLSENGKADQPYDSGHPCQATEETADEAIFGSASRKKKSNPVPPECMSRIEPLNPFVPLRPIRGQDNCAQNRRRFLPSQSKLHAGQIDHEAIQIRTSKRRVKFLAAVCPHLLPSATSSTVARKVFIDLGSRHYSTSCGWFRKNYPGASAFIIHGFDVSSKWAYSFQFDPLASFHTAAVWNETGFVSFVLKQDTFGGLFHRNFFDAPLDLGRLMTVPAVALSEALSFLVTKEDFVVVKMDVEGSEWMLVRHLAETGALDLIDELFIECHHGEFVPNWPSSHSLADCHRMFNSLRKAGVYAHEWY